MNSYDIAVIGGGSAGLVVAVGAAQLGARVALIEKKALGGDCLYTGCVPSKTLIRSARFAADVRRAEKFGFTLPQLQFKDANFAAITDRVQRVIQTVSKHDAPERFRNMGIEVIFGNPRFSSPTELYVELEDSTEVVRARRFCIATGSRPSVPPIDGLKKTGFITNEEVFHLQKLPSSMIVLGGGPTGVELGQSFARFGTCVTVVEMAERLLPREDEEVSALMHELLSVEGLKILLKTKGVAVGGNGENKTVTIEQNGQLQQLQCEEILVAIGRTPNIEGLNLEAARVKYDKGRIVTDEYLSTSASNIFAAGDVTGHFPFTHMAAYEAAVVVRNALFFWPVKQKVDFRVVPWAIFTDPEAGRVGLTEREARAQFGDENIHVYRSSFEENDRAQTDDETSGFIKLICRGRKNEIVGGHIVGSHAGDLIHEIVLAMKYRLPASSLGSLIHVYPTRSQISQRAGLEPIRSRLTPLAKKVLAHYFSWCR